MKVYQLRNLEGEERKFPFEMILIASLIESCNAFMPIYYTERWVARLSYIDHIWFQLYSLSVVQSAKHFVLSSNFQFF